MSGLMAISAGDCDMELAEHGSTDSTIFWAQPTLSAAKR